MRYGFVIDQRKCIGCHACTVACKEENQVPLGVNRTWVKYIEKGTFPDTRRYFAVLRCNHCDSAPCVTICPTVALYRRADGIVDLDRDRCIGCKSCMQACPYDALHIDPGTQTAAKCHYCAHRIERGLEPACVIVCPVQAIVPGDLDDPGSAIAALVASQPVQVRKPEQGTRPKLFYLGGDQAALAPDMQARSGQYAFAQLADIPAPGQPGRAETRPLPDLGQEPLDLLRLARTVYDVSHAARPWGFKVSSYLWTKSIAAGVLLLAGLATGLGAASGGPLVGIAAPLLGLIFLALTTALLVLDLKRPERFLYIFLKPNWRSWLVLGGWILLGLGGVGTLWLLAGLTGSTDTLAVLAWPLVLLALAAAGYSAFLFGQAEGRDFWQSPLVLPHLLAAALAAGSAALLLTALALDGVGRTAAALRVGLFLSLLLVALFLAAELGGRHPSGDAARAAELLRRGALSSWLWGGVVLAGLVLPGLLLLLPADATIAGGAWGLGAVLALAGLWVWEDLWVRAGQSAPLS
ncbi:MAG: polysulfide reductase NrfD [Candidatus Rokubacteria bacterium]|nr:polysulfide reductase NrfD [Candidatus Rokubacteria bacterium]